MKKTLKILLFLLLLTNCAASTKKLNTLSLGMTKSEVIDKMGDPDETNAAGRTEIFVYRLARQEDVIADYREYWLIFANGKLEKYGKSGDFRTSSPPTQKLIIQHDNIN